MSMVSLVVVVMTALTASLALMASLAQVENLALMASLAQVVSLALTVSSAREVTMVPMVSLVRPETQGLAFSRCLLMPAPILESSFVTRCADWDLGHFWERRG